MRARAGEELRTCLDGLGHGIRGNLDRAASVPRYLSAGPPRVEVRDEPHDTNPDTNPDPLPYPAVSWWWD